MIDIKKIFKIILIFFIIKSIFKSSNVKESFTTIQGCKDSKYTYKITNNHDSYYNKIEEGQKVELTIERLKNGENPNSTSTIFLKTTAGNLKSDLNFKKEEKIEVKFEKDEFKKKIFIQTLSSDEPIDTKYFYVDLFLNEDNPQKYCAYTTIYLKDKPVGEESVLDADYEKLKKKAEQEDNCKPIGEGENCW